MRGWVTSGRHTARARNPPAMCIRWPCAPWRRSHEGRSKHADEYRTVPFDLVVTVCDDAAENCPVWLGQGRRVHLGLLDPARATGTEDEVMAAFRQVRDDIAQQAPVLLKKLVVA
jgi:hypothetical protein